MKVVTFGELMIRLQPFNYERFVQANNLEFSFGGGEANVAATTSELQNSHFFFHGFGLTFFSLLVSNPLTSANSLCHFAMHCSISSIPSFLVLLKRASH